MAAISPPSSDPVETARWGHRLTQAGTVIACVGAIALTMFAVYAAYDAFQPPSLAAKTIDYAYAIIPIAAIFVGLTLVGAGDRALADARPSLEQRSMYQVV